jgi:integrase
MKAALLHRVPLSARAIAILEQLAEYRTCDFVFPGRRRQPIGKMAMSLIVPKGATTHGFRSSFSISNVEAAYRRSDALERRRALMDAWAAYVDPATGGNIVQLRQQANGI